LPWVVALFGTITFLIRRYRKRSLERIAALERIGFSTEMGSREQLQRLRIQDSQRHKGLPLWSRFNMPSMPKGLQKKPRALELQDDGSDRPSSMKKSLSFGTDSEGGSPKREIKMVGFGSPREPQIVGFDSPREPQIVPWDPYAEPQAGPVCHQLEDQPPEESGVDAAPLPPAEDKPKKEPKVVAWDSPEDSPEQEEHHTSTPPNVSPRPSILQKALLELPSPPGGPGVVSAFPEQTVQKFLFDLDMARYRPALAAIVDLEDLADVVAYITDEEDLLPMCEDHGMPHALMQKLWREIEELRKMLPESDDDMPEDDDVEPEESDED